jgi:hypothetical protein
MVFYGKTVSEEIGFCIFRNALIYFLGNESTITNALLVIPKNINIGYTIIWRENERVLLGLEFAYSLRKFILPMTFEIISHFPFNNR